jgi:hypothetical protein
VPRAELVEDSAGGVGQAHGGLRALQHLVRAPVLCGVDGGGVRPHGARVDVGQLQRRRAAGSQSNSARLGFRVYDRV